MMMAFRINRAGGIYKKAQPVVSPNEFRLLNKVGNPQWRKLHYLSRQIGKFFKLETTQRFELPVVLSNFILMSKSDR